MNYMDYIQEILLIIPGALLAFVIHGFARAYASDKLGDPSPRMMGKLNLSPRSHVDPIGFFLLVLLGFGWSKTVFTDSRYYKNPTKGKILVSLSGTIGNLLLAFVCLSLYKLLHNSITSFAFLAPLILILGYAVTTNIYLGLFCLVPLPPLDGFEILQTLVSYKYYKLIEFLQVYGNLILIFLIISRAIHYLIPYGLVYRLLDILTYPFDLLVR